MDNGKQFTSRLILSFFITQVIINWLYMLWVKNQPDIIINSWFVVMPMVGYFYFTFAFIASVWLFYRKQVGLYVAYGVLMFGTASAVLSCNIASGRNYMIEQLIIPLIAINLCVIFYTPFMHAT